MKAIKGLLVYLAIMLFLLASCSTRQDTVTESDVEATPPAAEQPAIPDAQTGLKGPGNLPVMYQTPSYIVGIEGDEELDLGNDATTVKVGATIKSTRGPQPLWDILKRLAALKNMNVSWASDVDQKVLVDVDINANDDFYEAIDNLLRQVDYFHEMQGNTIVVKYKETRRFRVAMPFVKSDYKTGVGGNLLGSDELSNNVDGTIELKAEGNTFDIWENIQTNMDKIIALWSTTAVTQAADSEPAQEDGGNTTAADETQVMATRQISSGGVTYLIDKPVGIVTVTAPRPLLNELQNYFDSLTTELYKQIAIEAKIIEVKLTDNSSIGINWNKVLQNFSVLGTVTFGDPSRDGQIWPYVSSNNSSFDDGFEHGKIYDPTRFVSKLALNPASFEVLLNALEKQGDTQVLSNPKISVMNGQPALLTVGRNVTYIDSVDADYDSDTGFITYTTETERILSGLGLVLTATILDDKEVIMNLVPITSELVEPIEYKEFGTLGTIVGLPIVNVREMSTTVRIKNNEMLVIGGLINEIKDTDSNFFPMLGKVPILRYLFGFEEKTNEKRELIILLKPRII
jgi:general secretion pathway protein D/MSHA biogenesis protein MshL